MLALAEVEMIAATRAPLERVHAKTTCRRSGSVELLVLDKENERTLVRMVA